MSITFSLFGIVLNSAMAALSLYSARMYRKQGCRYFEIACYLLTVAATVFAAWAALGAVN